MPCWRSSADLALEVEVDREDEAAAGLAQASWPVWISRPAASTSTSLRPGCAAQDRLVDRVSTPDLADVVVHLVALRLQLRVLVVRHPPDVAEDEGDEGLAAVAPDRVDDDLHAGQAFLQLAQGERLLRRQPLLDDHRREGVVAVPPLLDLLRRSPPPGRRSERLQLRQDLRLLLRGKSAGTIPAEKRGYVLHQGRAVAVEDEPARGHYRHDAQAVVLRALLVGLRPRTPGDARAGA